MPNLYRSVHTEAAGLRLRAYTTVLVACGLGLAGAGCSVRRTRATLPSHEMSTGASREAAVHEHITVERTDSGALYAGEGWTLTVGDGSGWQQSADAEGATLRLEREASGVRLSLTLTAYLIRREMPVETFLTAHALWMEEEGGPRVEYEQDERSGQWSGYSIHGDQEAYYAFFVCQDRAYVIEESASRGVMSRAEVDEFRRIVGAFRCYPRTPARPPLAPHDANSQEAP